MLSLVVARARNGAIGRGNTIPWHAPEDLAFFQRETTGGAVIMGRNTWESLPFKPLKNRLNIVITSRGVGAEHEVTSLQAAINLAEAMGHRRLYAIGGARVYAEALPLAHRLLVTEVELDVPDADTCFPAFGEGWRRIGGHVLREDGPRCVVGEWVRE
jgi:dihydrofolate reductase